MAPTTTEAAPQPLTLEERVGRLEKVTAEVLANPSIPAFSWRALTPERRAPLDELVAEVFGRGGQAVA